jgi:mRNA interferase MazF
LLSIVCQSGAVRSGEVWWARLDGRTPVVLLGGDRAIRVVEPATDDQRRGFLLLTGAEAADDETRERMLAAAGPSIIATGAEVGIAGLGVVRAAFPRGGKVFCTWETALTGDDLIERIAVLPADTRRQLDIVLRLAGPQPG